MSDTYDIPHALAGLAVLADMADKDFGEGCRILDETGDELGRDRRNAAVLAAEESLELLEPFRQRLLTLQSRGLL